MDIKFTIKDTVTLSDSELEALHNDVLVAIQTSLQKRHSKGGAGADFKSQMESWLEVGGYAKWSKAAA